MSKRDYYQVLGVAKNSGEADIKKAYRRLAMKFHPDRNPGDKEAEEKFKEAKEAYEVLSDAQKRATYDQFGHAGIDAARQGGGPGGAGGFHPGDAFGDVFGDVFGDIFGGGRRGGGAVLDDGLDRLLVRVRRHRPELRARRDIARHVLDVAHRAGRDADRRVVGDVDRGLGVLRARGVRLGVERDVRLDRRVGRVQVVHLEVGRRARGDHLAERQPGAVVAGQGDLGGRGLGGVGPAREVAGAEAAAGRGRDRARRHRVGLRRVQDHVVAARRHRRGPPLDHERRRVGRAEVVAVGDLLAGLDRDVRRDDLKAVRRWRQAAVGGGARRRAVAASDEQREDSGGERAARHARTVSGRGTARADVVVAAAVRTSTPRARGRTTAHDPPEPRRRRRQRGRTADSADRARSGAA